MTLDEQLAEIARLRGEGKAQEALPLLLKLVATHPDDPSVNYLCASVHDRLGLEREAVPYYETALANGLAEEDRSGAFLGLGSTLRSLGEYERAIEVFRTGIGEFPDGRHLRVFLAMALYNVGQYGEAMGLLLRELGETSSDPEIAGYRRAILFYADRLDETW
jgi:tetratricopeptide (TPR) repeat protein